MNNAHRRLECCKRRCLWTVEQWKKVLKSDESRYGYGNQMGVLVGTWRIPGERYLPECVVSILKFGVASVMVWSVTT